MSPVAAEYCQSKGFGTVEVGDVCQIPFADASFDLVLATDIIEHVDDDVQALTELRRVLTPGGRAIITVPAFQALWGAQDELAHHRRRYRRQQVLQAVHTAGLTARDNFYFNYLLFVPIWVARSLIKLVNIELRSENEINTPLLNWLLTKLFHFDVTTARLLSPPFGVSFLVIVEKPQ
jgi:SAM-dependent methyltransferase